MESKPATPGQRFEPRVMAFVCQWCTYTGADLAGTSRLEYRPNVRIIKLPCSARIDVHFILRAFEQGADGVLISGCHPGDCHYTAGNYYARRRFDMFRRLLDFLGVDRRRLQFSWVSAAEGRKWADVVDAVTEEVRQAGPFLGLKRVSDWHHLLADVERVAEPPPAAAVVPGAGVGADTGQVGGQAPAPPPGTQRAPGPPHT